MWAQKVWLNFESLFRSALVALLGTMFGVRAAHDSLFRDCGWHCNALDFGVVPPLSA